MHRGKEVPCILPARFIAADMAAAPRGSPGGNSGEDRTPCSDAALLKPKLVHVVLPDGTEEIRLVSLDIATGVLVLRQVNLDATGEPALHGKVEIKLGSVADGASAEGHALILRAGGAGGRKLLELRFETQSEATAWAKRLTQLHEGSLPVPETQQRQSPKVVIGNTPAVIRGGGGRSRGGGDRGGGHGARDDDRSVNVDMFRKVVAQQEEQVRLLETINKQKQEQMLGLKAQIDSQLKDLIACQESYAQQQHILEVRQRTVEDLTSKIAYRGVDMGIAPSMAEVMAMAAANACDVNSAQAAAGLAAARRAKATV